MSVNEDQLKSIYDKLQLLVKQQQLLQKENRQLKDDLQRSLQNNLQSQDEMEKLKQQVDILKFSNGEMDPEEKKQFEKRINSYVKEIDRCIALLSE